MNEQTIFTAALEREPKERSHFLAEACGPDLALRERVERLLRLHAEAGGFLEQPAAAQVGMTLDQSPAERPGTPIGPYKLIEQIGEGGMGVVWMAQQTEPVKRLVALKVIKPGMDSRQVIARFEAERQALALMDHPNIARVLDGGTTDAGRPYFVMDLVRGAPITQYCDEHHLTPQQRLELFLPVCQAVQHAHQKGIIHRDLKPNNVLVALYDGKPVPKVIDFGVAKAAGQPLTEQTLVTGFGNIVGTLEYMSPEQAETNQLDIDTRSDIYSLGVLLYELLTGSPPFSRKELEKAGMLEMLRVIREQEPSKPSTKLSTAEGLPTLAANRGTEPAKLTKLVRGELDWIVMKALEKDRSRRYETANGFAADIQRYLADEPVQACPPSLGYRFRKFARRNKSGLAVAALVLFFLVLLGTGAGWAWRDRAAQAAERANHLERAVERAEFLHREAKRGEARAALERAQLLAREAAPTLPLAKRIESLQQLLDAEGRDEDFVARFEAIRREVLTEVNVARNTLRGVNAYPRIREALDHFGITMGVTPPDTAAALIKARPPEIQVVFIAALDECGWFERDPGSIKWLASVVRKVDGDPWRTKVRRALGWWNPKALEDLLKDIDVRQQSPNYLLLVATKLPIESPVRLGLARRVQIAYPGDFWANHELGLCLAHAGKDAEAIRYSTAALALRPDNPGVLLNRAITLDRVGELEAAVADLERAITLSPRYAAAHYSLGRSLYAQNKPNEATAALRKAIELDPNLADAYRVLGAILREQQKLPEAIAAYRRAIELDPETASAHYNLGNALGSQNKLDDAIAAFRKAIELDPKWALAHDGLGYTLHEQKKLEQAIDAYKMAIALDPKHAPYHRNLGRVLRDLALRDQKKLDAAIAAYRKAIELDPKVPSNYVVLGALLCDDPGKYDEAIECCRKAIGLDPKCAPAYDTLGRALRTQGKLDEAIAAYRKAIEVDPKFVNAHVNLGGLLCDKLKEYDQAIECFRKAIEIDSKHAIAYANLGIALHRQEKLDEAIAAYRKAIEIDPNHTNARVNLPGALCKNARDMKNAAGCLAVAAEYEAVKGTNAGWLYNAACFRALSASAILEDPKTPAADAARLGKEQADLAMGWLRKAIAAGYKDVASMKQDKDLDALRDREDFNKLLAELENRKK